MTVQITSFLYESFLPQCCAIWFFLATLLCWQEVLTTRWQDKYPRGGIHDGRGFGAPLGRSTGTGNLSSLFPSAINASGHSRHFRQAPFQPAGNQTSSQETLPLSLPQVDGRNNRQVPKRPTAETTSQVDPLSVSRSSFKFGATMRNSLSVHEIGHAPDRWPGLGHATELRNFVRSRQGSSRSNRAGSAFEPIWDLCRFYPNLESIVVECFCRVWSYSWS